MLLSRTQNYFTHVAGVYIFLFHCYVIVLVLREVTLRNLFSIGKEESSGLKERFKFANLIFLRTFQ